MSRNVIDSLKAWKRKRQTWVRMMDFKQETECSNLPPVTKTLREVERCIWQAAFDPAQTMETEWEPEISPSALAPVARCQVVKFAGDQAECIVLLDGFELPRVGFPVWVLKQKGLVPGKRFHWIMRDGSRVRPADIDPDVPQTDEMTVAERANLDRLYEEFKRGRAEDGGHWPEYTGPGR